MAQNAPNEVDEAIKALKSRSGYSAYILMNNDGIVIKYENVEYTKAVMYAYHILDLYSKSKNRVAQLMDTDNEVECLRVPESSVNKNEAGMTGEETKEKEAEEKVAG